MKSLAQLFALGCIATGLQAATVLVGTPGGGNCYPYSCGPSDGVTRYQQVYSSSAFAGPLSINSLTIFQNATGGPMDGGTYQLSLSTTSASVSTLSSDLDSNVGTDAALFDIEILSGFMPSSITFSGTPFFYKSGQRKLASRRADIEHFPARRLQ